MAVNSNSCGSGSEAGLSELKILLVGSDHSGKSSARSIILNRNPSDVEKSERCVKEEGVVAGRKITVIEAPGWCNDKPVEENTDLLKKETVLGASMCSPGPHAVLLVENGDRTFTEKEREILSAYLNLLGDSVRSHTVILFIFEDPLGDRTIEQYIGSEGQDLQELVEKCDNRYYVFDNMKANDGSQVPELLMKIEEMVAGNGGCHFKLDTKILPNLRERTSDKKGGTLRQRESRTHISRIHREKSGENNGTKKATSVQHSDPEHPSADPELFTPKEVVNDSEDKDMAEYRFFFTHAGLYKCTLTKIMFEMEGEGNVQYSVLIWNDNVLDKLGQKEPAGPLYDINCPERSVRRLHLPHCEKRKYNDLTVAHMIGQKMELIQPLTVTDTHVTIDVHRLSPFGLTLPLNKSSIGAQVLLFYKIEHEVIRLHIYLLPANVPIAEVEKQHKDFTNVTTTSDCVLIRGKKYRLQCKVTGRDYKTHPEFVKFRHHYGPNYHPTFEVQFPRNAEFTDIVVLTLDKKGEVLWKSPDLQLSACTERKSSSLFRPDFADQHREQLIQRVSSVMEVADVLKSRTMMSAELHSKINAEQTTYEKMRLLYTCLDSGGREVKAEFYQILREIEPYLVKELESKSA